MLMKKIILFLLVGLSYPIFSSAQIDLCLPVATARGGAVTAVVNDWEAIGINPSNLGWKNNHKFSITILGVGLSAQSSALDFNTLKNALTSPGDTFSKAQKQHFAQVFSNKNGLNLYGDVNWLAFSLNLPKIGGFAMNVRDVLTAHLGLSATAADIMFNGLQSQAYQDSSITLKKISQELAGTNFGLYYYRELNLDYGRELFHIGGSGKTSTASFDGGKAAADTADDALRFYGGIGLKYLWGLANVYGQVTDGGINAHSSVSSSFGINYGNSIPGFTSTSVANLFNNTGTGYGVDLGLSAVYKRWKFGVSATDLGALNWTHNTLTAIDTNMPKLNPGNNGINSWSSIGNFAFADNSIMTFRPGPDYSVPLPAKLRTGVSYIINKWVTVSSDVVFPLNNVIGNIETPFYSVAGQITIFKTLMICTGLAGSQVYGFDVPFGITFSLKNFIQFYIATSDITTYFGRTNNPNISAAFGLLRFNL
jgi:hypothetical protein